MPPKFVVDSSVILKWLNQTNENYIEQSNKLLQDIVERNIPTLEPELAKYEVGNILLFSKKLTLAEAKISLASLYSLPVHFVPQSENLANETYKIAQEYKITFYDASFVALAKQEKATLVTDNPKHQAKIREVKVVSLVDY